MAKNRCVIGKWLNDDGKNGVSFRGAQTKSIGNGCLMGVDFREKGFYSSYTQNLTIRGDRGEDEQYDPERAGTGSKKIDANMIKFCFAANSGGHLNQLLQLDDFANRYTYFFVTDRNQFSEELAQREKVFFVEKFIIKECIRTLNFFIPIRNLWQSFLIIKREQPDIIVTTGAGTAFGSCIAGRLFRKKIIFIESIARVGEPSTFGRVISPIASVVFVQWENMMKYYKRAIYTGAIFNFGKAFVDKQENKRIFVTTGTYKLQFNRVLIELDRLKETGWVAQEVVAQTGKSTYQPKHYETFDFAPQAKIHELVALSDIIICHGGSGSIMDSLIRGKKVIAVPRLKEFDEFFDDHQLQIVRELERLGVILAVYDIADLGNAIKEAESFRPKLENIPNRVEELLSRFIADNFSEELP